MYAGILPTYLYNQITMGKKYGKERQLQIVKIIVYDLFVKNQEDCINLINKGSLIESMFWFRTKSRKASIRIVHRQDTTHQPFYEKLRYICFEARFPDLDK